MTLFDMYSLDSGVGTLGYSFDERRQAHLALRKVIADKTAFAPADTSRAVCIDSRLRETTVRLPGGGILLAYLRHFLTGKSPLSGQDWVQKWCGIQGDTHGNCGFASLDVPFVREVFADPQPEQYLLWRIGYEQPWPNFDLRVFPRWASTLPDNFMSDYDELASACPRGKQDVITAILNMVPQTTFARQELLRMKTGLDALSVDLWAADYLPTQLTRDVTQQAYLRWMIAILCAATVRRLGAPHLILTTCLPD